MMHAEIYDTLDRLLGDVCTPSVLRKIESGQEAPSVLWQALIDSGFLDLMLPETADGAGLGWSEAWSALFVAGYHGLPVTLGQTMWGRVALYHLGRPVPNADYVLSLSGFGQLDQMGWVTAKSVSGACLSTAMLIQVGDAVYEVALKDCEIEPVGGPGCFDAHVRFKADRPCGSLPAGTLAQALATILAIQMAGAADRVLALTLAYANERQQFGKPIGRFQAVQQQISEMAEHVYAMRMASQLAVQSDSWYRTVQQAALAKSQNSASAALVASIAHAVHGAIGITQEHDLQLLTRKLYEWARQGGGELYWAARIGQAALSHDAGLLDFVRETMFGASAAGLPAV